MTEITIKTTNVDVIGDIKNSVVRQVPVRVRFHEAEIECEVAQAVFQTQYDMGTPMEIVNAVLVVKEESRG